ncbi:hypothetical protein GF394_03540 [Candidatus Fermentibacteria bacterium]|nr:hypothetical protein [Candidatus Fermentibacteria bacterium]
MSPARRNMKAVNRRRSLPKQSNFFLRSARILSMMYLESRKSPKITRITMATRA